MNFTEKQREILDFKKQNPSLSVNQISIALGTNYEYTRRTILATEEYGRMQELQDSIAPKLSERKRFEGNGIITGDYHCPAVDMKMVDYVIQDAQKERIRRLFIVGDFINFDVLSAYARKLNGDERLPKVSDELLIGYLVMCKLSEVFDEIWYFAGNHEKRFARAVSNTLTFDVIIKTFDIDVLRLVNSYDFYIDDIRVVHPKSYSQIKLSVANKLSATNTSPIIQAHGHFFSAGFGLAGEKYPICDLGCMCDAERIPYMNEELTTYPKWNRGYWIYKDGQLYPRANRFGLNLYET